MLDPSHPLAELLRRDSRYHRDSYIFVFDSLRFAQERLNMGRVVASPPGPDPVDYEEFDGEFDSEEFESEEFEDEDFENFDDNGEPIERVEKHVTGQDLCEAMRQFALSQYGLLAKSVLNHWGVRSTGDFGEIVFNLIDIGQMKKTDNDRREDFDDVYDFAEALADWTVFAEGAPGAGASEDEESSGG